MSDPRPESMADVMADATRHTDQVLVHARSLATSGRGPAELRNLVANLADLASYWREACHAADARTDQLRAELDQARWRPYTYNLNHGAVDDG